MLIGVPFRISLYVQCLDSSTIRLERMAKGFLHSEDSSTMRNTLYLRTSSMSFRYSRLEDDMDSIPLITILSGIPPQ